MTGDDERRQRAVMATDEEWERIGRAAAAAGMDRSRFVLHRALARDALPSEVRRRAVRETLVLSLLEERRLRDGGLAETWEDACDAVDAWIDGEGTLERLTDPGAANRWKALGAEPDGEDPGTGPPEQVPRNRSGAGWGRLGPAWAGWGVPEEPVRSGRRQWSLHCRPEEQAMIRERAAAAGQTVSRYLLDLALADDPDRHPLVLTEDEQAGLRDGIGEVEAFVLALKRELPGAGGLSLLAAIAVLARAGDG